MYEPVGDKGNGKSSDGTFSSAQSALLSNMRPPSALPENGNANATGSVIDDVRVASAESVPTVIPSFNPSFNPSFTPSFSPSFSPSFFPFYFPYFFPFYFQKITRNFSSFYFQIFPKKSVDNNPEN